MMYRNDRNENNFSDASLLVWEMVMPFRFLPILDSDTIEAK